MDVIVINYILKYLKKCDLNKFGCIKNSHLHGIISYLNFQILLITLNNIEKIKDIYYLYDKTIRRNWVDDITTKLGSKVFKTMFKSKNVDHTACYNDADLAFISFCDFKIEGLYLKYADLTSNGLEYLQFCDLSELKILQANNVIKFLTKLELKSLIELDLNDSKILDEDIKILSGLKLEKLKKLNFSNNKITDKGLEYLIKCDFINITHLFFCKTEITCMGLVNLSRCNFPELKFLDLTGTIIVNLPEIFKVKYQNCTVWRNN